MRFYFKALSLQVIDVLCRFSDTGFSCTSSAGSKTVIVSGAMNWKCDDGSLKPTSEQMTVTYCVVATRTAPATP